MKLRLPTYFRRSLTLKRQASGSNICGQCCVAMVADCSVLRSIATIGHNQKTSWTQLITALNKLGIPCANKPTNCGPAPKPNLCIVRLRSKERPSGGHFVVWSHDAWYDPALGFSKNPRHHRWTPDVIPISYLEIL